MTKQIALASSFVLAAFAVQPAAAATATLAFDNFNLTQPSGGNFLIDSSARPASCTNPGFGGTGAQIDSGAVLGLGITRAVSINLCNGVRPFRSAIGVNIDSSSRLDIVNDPGEVSVGSLRYDLGTTSPFSAFAAAFNNGIFSGFGFRFRVVTSDDNPVSVRGVLMPTNGPTYTLPILQIGGNFTGDFFYPIQPPLPLTVDDLHGTLDFIFTGSAGYDIAVDNLGFFVRNGSDVVPAPGAIALLGLGLTGLAIARRSR